MLTLYIYIKSANLQQNIQKLKMGPPPITTATILFIGNDILNGKTVDPNSRFFAKYCNENKIDLQNITVVPDEENAIIDNLQKLTKQFLFVVTTGGIGSTHADITYQSIAKAYNAHLVTDFDVKNRVEKYGEVPHNGKNAYSAYMCMATLPVEDKLDNVCVGAHFIMAHS